jgi:replicative DNA helicase
MEIRDIDTGLPAAIDCERTVLGAILNDNEAFFDDTAIIESDDFHLDSHRRIYVVMTEILFGMIEGAKSCDIVTLANELRKRNWVESVGGVAYLAGLTEGLPRRPVITEYVRIIKDKALLRRIMSVCTVGAARAADQSMPAIEVLGSVQVDLAEIVGEGINNAVDIGSITPAVESSVLKARQITDDRTALEMTWGHPKMDAETRGCFRGEFSVLSGESSGGKTAFAVQVTIANAREGTPVLWFSLEMTKEQLARRFYASMSDKLTAAQMRDPRLMNQHTHIPAMHEVSKELSRLPIKIDDTTPLRIDKLRARIRMMRRKLAPRPDDKLLVIIDYLQLIRGMPKMSPQEKTELIIFTLRDLPKVEPNIHILALSQYSQGEKIAIKNKRRSKDALFGGSVIHHAAQNIFMLSIEDPEKRDPRDLLDAEIKIEKQREGKRTKVTTSFDRDHLTFADPQPYLRS